MEYSDYPVHAWSRSRHTMLRICPRKALLSCQEARKGADPLAEPELRYLHELRNRIPLQYWLDRMLQQLLRELFYRQQPDEPMLFSTPEVVAGVLTEQFDRDLEKMLCGVSSRDHRLRFIRELEQRPLHLSLLVKQARNRINHICQALKKELWQLLSATPVISRRNIDSPLRIQINDLCCYSPTLMALERNGEFWIIGCGMDERNAVLHKFYAMNELGREPHLIRSFDYEIDSGNFSECGLNVNISLILQQISEDGARWNELLQTPPDQIPGNPEHCRFCEFEHYCSKYCTENIKLQS